MLVLLPPSETKRDGGGGPPIDLGTLAYPQLTRQRRTLVRALRTLSKDTDAAVSALKLGRTQHAEIERNRGLGTAPTLPAMDRYTGVLYDALDAASLDPAARAFAADHVVVHSALFGPIGAGDLIPAYRLSHDSRLPGLSMKKHWNEPIARALGGRGSGTHLTLDLRSEAYVALGAAPAGALFLRVVAEGADGQRRALNHFNKKAKGEFTRALIQHREDFDSVDALLGWAASAGITLTRGAPGELELLADEVVAARRA